MGSRSTAGSNAAWLTRGTRFRAPLPSSARTVGWTHGRAVQTSPLGGSTFHAASYSAAVASSGTVRFARRTSRAVSVIAWTPQRCTPRSGAARAGSAVCAAADLAGTGVGAAHLGEVRLPLRAAAVRRGAAAAPATGARHLLGAMLVLVDDVLERLRRACRSGAQHELHAGTGAQARTRPAPQSMVRWVPRITCACSSLIPRDRLATHRPTGLDDRGTRLGRAETAGPLYP